MNGQFYCVNEHVLWDMPQLSKQADFNVCVGMYHATAWQKGCFYLNEWVPQLGKYVCVNDSLAEPLPLVPVWVHWPIGVAGFVSLPQPRQHHKQKMLDLQHNIILCDCTHNQVLFTVVELCTCLINLTLYTLHRHEVIGWGDAVASALLDFGLVHFCRLCFPWDCPAGALGCCGLLISFGP